MKKIFIDYERCVGCKACEIACAVEHHPEKSLYALVGDSKVFSNVRVVAVDYINFASSCRHCDPAYCMDACPSGAIQRDEETDAVIVDPYMCKACAMCAMTCPFDAITFKETHYSAFNRDYAVKCDFCVDRVKNGELPACVESCKTNALVFQEADEFVRNKEKNDLKAYLLGASKEPENIRLYKELKKKMVV
ncbi:MAG: 4Fe-4S dicluster domain-containing protein [Flexistipes sinusarabici]|uniref:4Fe-4S dicluster domain-containing protein n=1 Tax=Flexistipes sinusarabici TaxID=2352 RepID=A0A5D0MG70_FLESI|nr:4Fe-4S dicluster domain-containing protein [Flexistipes sinusarabici]TYB32704.1 MAG: 4Fe-4S dicluster domain-containing protein [Flexistipes sinusarabici]